MNKLVWGLLIFSLVITGCASSSATEAVIVLEPTQVQETNPTDEIVSTAQPTVQVVSSLEPILTAVITSTQVQVDFTIEDVIEYEMKGAFDFFWEQANTDEGSPGYGLIRDRYPGSPGISSIASIGFGLTAYLVGIEKEYISYEEGFNRVDKTLDTLSKLERTEGFFYHYVDMDTGKRAWSSEVSSIDTSILLMGVLAAGEYFGGEVEVKAKQIYSEVNWPWFIDDTRDMFYMAYRPGKGFEGYWDFYAEQLMIYILAAGSNTYTVEDDPYYTFTRHYARYGEGEPFIHSWFGSIFTYQYSHAWIDFRNYSDREGVNWFDNSVEASLAQANFAAVQDRKLTTLGPEAWGLSASDGPDGYNGRYGAPPSGFDNSQHFIDDTIPPSGAIGSIIFVPEQAQYAMLNYYTIEELRGPFGFTDAYNLSEDWYAPDVIGIDKGVSLLMLANFQGDIVYRIMMENEYILNGLERLEITGDR